MARKFTPTPIKLLNPVPSDIDVAQAGTLKPIMQVAEELGLQENELELYGPYKAKIKLETYERLKNRPNGKKRHCPNGRTLKKQPLDQVKP